MDLVTIDGERSCRIVSEPTPKAVDDWVVIQVETTPMCTEYKAYQAGYSTNWLGHEAAGTVFETAAGAGRLQVGDRVLALPLMACGSCRHCNAGEYIFCKNGRQSPGPLSTYAQYHAKPEWMCYRFPDDIETEKGALAICGLGPSFGALQRMAVDAYDTVLITGLGPVGLGGVINAKHRGATVIAVEAQPFRKQLAADLGADHVLDPTDDGTLEHIRDLTEGEGVPKAVDCSGNPAAHRLCIDAAAIRGQVAFVGECSDDTVIRISPDMIRKGLTLIGSWNYNRGDMEKIMQVIRDCDSDLNRFITHRFPLRKAQDAWEMQMTGNCGKVLLKPWEDV